MSFEVLEYVYKFHFNRRLAFVNVFFFRSSDLCNFCRRNDFAYALCIIA